MTEINYDLIVVGGGPGGATVSTLVAKQGFRVLLLEKELFPRHQVGESLLPATVQGICSLLGVKDEVDAAGFMPKKGGTFIWGKSTKPWQFYFETPEEGELPKSKAYQVERAKFDSILLNNAIKSGVEVRQEVSAFDVIKNEDRVCGVKYRGKDGTEKQLIAKYVVDASGHTSKISNHVGTRVYSKLFNNIAIYGYYTGGKRLPEPNSGNILSVAFKHGWFWYIPLSSELTSVGVVFDRELIEKPGANPEKVYQSLIDECPIIKEYLSEATRATGEVYSKVRIRKDYSYTSTKFWTPGMLVLGDSACFVDPVFSSGVHLSTYAGLLAARSINTFLKGTVNEEKCLNEFESRYRKEYGNFYNFLLAFYDMNKTKDDYFWAARNVLNTQEQKNEAFIRLIAGYSTEGIPDVSGAEEFFSVRKNFGDGFAQMMQVSDEEPVDLKIDMDGFMKGFTQEIVNLQLQAVGVNMERMQETEGLVSSDDLFHWE